MFLKHRNAAALALIFAAAVCWTIGKQLISAMPERYISETAIYATAAATFAPTLDPTVDSTDASIPADASESIFPSTPAPSIPGHYESNRPGSSVLGFILCFLSAGCAIAAVVLFPRSPLPGPDGIVCLMALYLLIPYAVSRIDYIVFEPTRRFWSSTHQIIVGTLVLIAIREYMGWLRAGLPLNWCLVHRLSNRCSTLRASLFTLVAWTFLSLLGAGCTLFQPGIRWQPTLFLISGGIGLICLWNYGRDVSHLQEQLERFRNGQPIAVGDGAFSHTEEKLLEIQAQHEEAVRAAVTSERFKVELISNVSHDLRTPLTAILGYSELLQKESLSPEGQEQLRGLRQKAGYMRDLVEELFELTKVSSGAAERKMEKIDLIRLLEQTVGLFDDQLTATGLCVRRRYPADSIPICTDGARMHQVFANLLENAIKYALPGTRIYWEILDEDEFFRIRMTNTASYEMNFDPSEITRRFARGDKARSSQGSGIGLAIAQTYTEFVGGRFWIDIDGDQFSAIVELPKSERKL